jgi:hypothetical protein
MKTSIFRCIAVFNGIMSGITISERCDATESRESPDSNVNQEYIAVGGQRTLTHIVKHTIALDQGHDLVIIPHEQCDVNKLCAQLGLPPPPVSQMKAAALVALHRIVGVIANCSTNSDEELLGMTSDVASIAGVLGTLDTGIHGDAIDRMREVAIDVIEGYEKIPEGSAVWIQLDLLGGDGWFLATPEYLSFLLEVFQKCRTRVAPQQ